MPTTSEDCIKIGLESQAVEIGYNNSLSFDLVDFLFQDLPRPLEVSPHARFDVVAAGRKPMLSLWQGERRYYFGESRYQLAYILVNEVVYHCIAKNGTQHAIHAGAIHDGTKGVIFPGKSGAGKSTLTAWLLTRGFGYLSDELIMLSADGRITPFTRPVSFKTSHLRLFPEILDDQQESIISDEQGTMVPHRLFNSKFSAENPFLTTIVFPEYRENCATTVEELSPAKSCQMLLESYVNARNLSGLGISSLSSLVKKSKSYKLVYGGFDGLEETMATILPF